MMLVPFADDAACRGADTNQFFIGTGESSKPAKQICEGCKVKKECLDWSITYRITYGIWGGKTVRERRQIARELVTAGAKSGGEVAPVVTGEKLTSLNWSGFRPKASLLSTGFHASPSRYSRRQALGSRFAVPKRSSQ